MSLLLLYVKWLVPKITLWFRQRKGLVDILSFSQNLYKIFIGIKKYLYILNSIW